MSDDIEQGPVGTGEDGEYVPAGLAPQNAASRIEHVTIEDEMRNAYIDYSMSVIVGRALPDVRDGLKPTLPFI